MSAIFYNNDTDHVTTGIKDMFTSLVVTLSGELVPGYMETPSVVLSSVVIAGSKVDMTFNVSADIVGIASTYQFHTGVGSTNNLLSDDGAVGLQVGVSYVSLPDGTYECTLPIRLRNIRISPVRHIQIGTEVYDNSFVISSGYNVNVTVNNMGLDIFGGPGAGLGKYIKGGLDEIYKGIRSVNGISIDNNVDITMEDNITEHGGKVNA